MIDQNLPIRIFSNYVRTEKMGKDNWRLLYLTNDPNANYEDIKDKINPNVKFCYHMNGFLHIKKPNESEINEYIKYIKVSKNLEKFDHEKS